MNRLAPPIFAAWLIRALCSQRDRDTIGGDLLEEYRDRHHRYGRANASSWYWRQAIGFVTLANCWALTRRQASHHRVTTWAIAIALVEFLVFFLLPSFFEISEQSQIGIFITFALTAVCAIELHPREWPSLLIGGWKWGMTFGVLAGGTLSFGRPGARIFVISAILLFMTIGFCSARIDSLWRGTVTAAAASTFGATIATFAAEAAFRAGFQYPHPPLTYVVPSTMCIGSILGTLGALCGSAVRSFASRTRLG